MPILIDGHNLIGRFAGLSLEDSDDEESLVRLLQSYRARTGKAVTVVFDPGTSPSLAQRRRVGGVQVVFAPHGSSADAVIERRVARSQNPRGLLVVTSDRKLAAAVTRLGARVQPAEDFAVQLERPAGQSLPQREEPPSPEEVERWLALFENHDGSESLDDAD